MSLGQRSLLGMLTGGLSVILKTALNIVLIPTLIAKLGLEAFGLYVLLIAIFEISNLLDLGITDALVTSLSSEAHNPQAKNNFLKVGHVLFSVLALLFLLGGALVYPGFSSLFHVSPDLQPLAQAGFFLIILESVLMVYGAYYQAVLLSHCSQQWTNLADSVYALVSNVGAILVLWLGGSLPLIFGLRLLAALLRLGIIVVQANRVEPRLWFQKTPFCIQTLKKLFRLSGHAMMINFSIIVSHKIDDIVIAKFLPISAVGVYEMVFRFLGVTLQICLKLHEGIYPLFARMASLNQTAEARQLFLRASCFLNFVGASTLMLIVIFYPELFGIFSAGKVPIAQTLPILALAVPCVLSGILQMPANAFLFTWGQHRFLSITSILAALANLGLSFVLVQHWGIVGVTLGTLIPQLLQHQWGLVGQVCRTLEISASHYLKSVYGAILFPLLVSFSWAQLGRFLMIHRPIPNEALELAIIAFIAVSALCLGLWLWLRQNTTTQEKAQLRQFVVQKFFRQNEKNTPSALTLDSLS
jgi:O-antigen/teichoic acid export membrane protein